MKKLFVILTVVAFSTSSFAQTEKTTTTTHPAGAVQVDKKMAHECYMMKDNALMHCMGTKAEPLSGDVTLKNGTMISAKGEVTMADGSKEMLANGQCIDLNGKIGDCEKMHMGMKHDDKMMEEKKMEDQK